MVDVVISNNTTGTYAGDYAGVEDAMIRSGDPTTNYESNTDDYIADWPQNFVIRFGGLSNITGPITVSAASVMFYKNSGGNSLTINFQRLLRNWVVDEVTWNIWATGNSWTTGGAESDGNDRDADVSLAFDTTGGGGNEVERAGGATMYADIEGWVNGDFSNNGYVLEIGSGQFYTRTSDNTDTATKPALLFTYAAAAGVTEQVPSGAISLTQGTPKKVMRLVEKVPAHGT